MKSKVVLLVLLLLMAGSFTTAAVALVKVSDDDKASHGHRHEKGDRAKGHHGKVDMRAQRDPHSHLGGRLWKDYWRDLTPAQRAEKMAELAQQHADGMKAWAACVQKAGDDKAARAKCERPLPPGLAKKRLGR